MDPTWTPINRLPIMAKSVLDLYELYNLVIARGGLVDVINKKLWQEIIKGLHLPSSITSAAFTLRTHQVNRGEGLEHGQAQQDTPQMIKHYYVPLPNLMKAKRKKNVAKCKKM
ncbi:Protein dead ringer [Blattella germanica]|nr:Protein dead ringer [Blattella germanica]